MVKLINVAQYMKEFSAKFSLIKRRSGTNITTRNSQLQLLCSNFAAKFYFISTQSILRTSNLSNSIKQGFIYEYNIFVLNKIEVMKMINVSGSFLKAVRIIEDLKLIFVNPIHV